ncbi:MAG TPA: App1 family protein [Pyrinomonadaceae bacterium]|nr:App1 family protein [Pyrinomonadaceae bacterium]
MQLHARLLLLNVLLAASLYGWCGNNKSDVKKTVPPAPAGPSSPTLAKSTAPARLPVTTEKEVTFYPTYGYKDAKGWNINLRGWVHEDRKELNKLAEKFSKCSEVEMANFRARSADFADDNKTFEKVVIKFDSDPDDKAYELSKSKSDGIVKIALVFPDEKAKQLLEKQGSTNGWLTFRAVSREHTGLGRIKLIEPGAGESLVTDIDDTIKITEIPGPRDVVLRNTFCLDFKAVLEPDMAKNYRERGDIPVHYVSGGPEQLFGPLYDYLITGAGGFPEGTFHLRFFPTPASLAGIKTLIDTARSSLDTTFDHKVREIKKLMEMFPDRKFTLVGDSGEVDPEVYNEIRKWRPAQVKEIIIRDVINDDAMNHFRLESMTIIKVNPPVCVERKHFDDLKKKIKEKYPTETYQRNSAPPCAPVNSNSAAN